MVGTLTALLKTVRSVEDEASRGARALESTMEGIKQAVIVSYVNIYRDILSTLIKRDFDSTSVSVLYYHQHRMSSIGWVN